MKRMVTTIALISHLFSTGFDTSEGEAIRQGVHIEWYRTVSPGMDGEGIFVWSDTRYGMRNIFAHKVNQEGQFMWGESGAVVTNLPGRQEDPVSITDGNGGVFIAWVDYRFDEQGDIFYQHLDSNGEILLDAGGIALAQVPGKQITINMCTDSSGGVFVTWQDKRGGIDDDIYGTHISASHDIIAPGSGVPIVVEGGNQNAKTIEYAGNGEAFIAWADFRDGANADIYAQRLTTSMVELFQTNGMPIAATAEQELKPRATFISSTTSFICWKEGDESSQILYQFVNESGTVFSDARKISDNLALQSSPRVKRSSLGDIFVNWKDLRDDPIDGDQYFQKVDASGDILWGDGVRVDPIDDVDFSARFVAGNNGDLNVIWERGTFPEVDIFYMNINSDGNLSQPQPLAISETDGYQFAPILLGTTTNEIFAIYGDKGSGSIDLKVQKINSSTFLTEWENNGIAAMTGLDGDINYTNSFRVSDNDLYVLWEDNRASKKIFGTRITDLQTSNGNGKQLTFGDNSSSETDFTTPKMIDTPTGKYIATFDGSSAPKIIRLNRLDEELNNAWSTSGISLSAVSDMRSTFLVETSSGIGCFWSESRGINYDIYYQSVDQYGNLLLNELGVEIVSSLKDDYLLDVVPTNDGKYMIFWMEDAWPAATIKFSKMDQAGNLEIGWNPNGYDLSNSNFDSRNLQVKASTSGDGLLAVWNQRLGSDQDIYSQFIDWEGNVQWEDDGLPVVEADNDQNNFTFEFNETGSHAFVSWQDFRNGNDFEIFADVININDGALNGQGSVQFSQDTTNQYNPLVTAIQGNEFFIIWEDERGYYNEDPLLINGVDLYGSGYIINQGLTTQMNGIPISIAYHKQENINVTPHSEGEYFLDWIDYRSSGKEDLANYYGKTLLKAELLSLSKCDDCDPILHSYGLLSAYPNPFNGNITFDFKIGSNEPAKLHIFNLAGELILDRLILPGQEGFYRFSWDAVGRNGKNISTGLYLYRFSTNSSISTGKISYLK